MHQKEILTFRHGQPEEGMQKSCRGGSSDCLLSEEGLRQTEANVSYLVDRFGGDLSKVVVVTSAMKRTDAFGELMAEQGAQFKRDPRFTAIHAGAWEGKPWKEIEEESPDQFRNCTEDGESLMIPGGERIPDLKKRVLQAWQEWIRERCACLVIVAHDSTNAVIKHAVRPNGRLNLRGQKIAAAHEYRMDAHGNVVIVEENKTPYLDAVTAKA